VVVEPLPEQAPPTEAGMVRLFVDAGRKSGVRPGDIVGAIANDGTLMQPRLLRATFDADGTELRRVEPRRVRQVVSPETAQTLTRLLVRVVEQGTGHNAAIPGYEVAGKTGTAQKLDPTTRRYSHAPGVLSFVGFAPADDPRFVMLVLLDEPRNEKWGSEAAAPVFAAIGREILRYLEVPPRDAQPVQIVAGQPAESRLGSAVRLVSTAPAGGAPEGLVPDLGGLTLRQALATLAALRLEVRIGGQGRVVGQIPAPGTPLAPGMVVSLRLRSGAVRP